MTKLILDLPSPLTEEELRHLPLVLKDAMGDYMRHRKNDPTKYVEEQFSHRAEFWKADKIEMVETGFQVAWKLGQVSNARQV